ncbi:hypothetical protein HY504_00220 [Candidatus Wolfebacteria bacterium]|nr:hypothetical protein [Candidatus Wolfebacteria bacterium]
MSRVRVPREIILFFLGVVFTVGLAIGGVIGVSFLVKVARTALGDDSSTAPAAQHFDIDGLKEIGVLPPQQ